VEEEEVAVMVVKYVLPARVLVDVGERALVEELSVVLDEAVTQGGRGRLVDEVAAAVVSVA
jgi:hypothetical protein